MTDSPENFENTRSLPAQTEESERRLAVKETRWSLNNLVNWLSGLMGSWGGNESSSGRSLKMDESAWSRGLGEFGGKRASSANRFSMPSFDTSSLSGALGSVGEFFSNGWSTLTSKFSSLTDLQGWKDMFSNGFDGLKNRANDYINQTVKPLLTKYFVDAKVLLEKNMPDLVNYASDGYEGLVEWGKTYSDPWVDEILELPMFRIMPDSWKESLRDNAPLVGASVGLLPFTGVYGGLTIAGIEALRAWGGGNLGAAVTKAVYNKATLAESAENIGEIEWKKYDSFDKKFNHLSAGSLEGTYGYPLNSQQAYLGPPSHTDKFETGTTNMADWWTKSVRAKTKNKKKPYTGLFTYEKTDMASEDDLKRVYDKFKKNVFNKSPMYKSLTMPFSFEEIYALQEAIMTMKSGDRYGYMAKDSDGRMHFGRFGMTLAEYMNVFHAYDANVRDANEKDKKGNLVKNTYGGPSPKHQDEVGMYYVLDRACKQYAKFENGALDHSFTSDADIKEAAKYSAAVRMMTGDKEQDATMRTKKFSTLKSKDGKTSYKNMGMQLRSLVAMGEHMKSMPGGNALGKMKQLKALEADIPPGTKDNQLGKYMSSKWSRGMNWLENGANAKARHYIINKIIKMHDAGKIEVEDAKLNMPSLAFLSNYGIVAALELIFQVNYAQGQRPKISSVIRPAEYSMFSSEIYNKGNTSLSELYRKGYNSQHSGATTVDISYPRIVDKHGNKEKASDYNARMTRIANDMRAQIAKSGLNIFVHAHGSPFNHIHIGAYPSSTSGSGKFRSPPQRFLTFEQQAHGLFDYSNMNFAQIMALSDSVDTKGGKRYRSGKSPRKNTLPKTEWSHGKFDPKEHEAKNKPAPSGPAAPVIPTEQPVENDADYKNNKRKADAGTNREAKMVEYDAGGTKMKIQFNIYKSSRAGKDPNKQTIILTDDTDNKAFDKALTKIVKEGGTLIAIETGEQGLPNGLTKAKAKQLAQGIQ